MLLNALNFGHTESISFVYDSWIKRTLLLLCLFGLLSYLLLNSKEFHAYGLVALLASFVTTSGYAGLLVMDHFERKMWSNKLLILAIINVLKDRDAVEVYARLNKRFDHLVFDDEFLDVNRYESLRINYVIKRYYMSYIYEDHINKENSFDAILHHFNQYEPSKENGDIFH